MLAFFRRLINSKVGVIVTLGVLVVIALAFAAGDVTGLRAGPGGVLGGGGVAKVGSASITSAELRARADNEMQTYREQQPSLTLAEYATHGGLEATLDRLIGSLALDRFGQGAGMVSSKRAVDGQIASIPSLQGIDGKFDQGLYQQFLAQRHLTDAQIRGDIARGLIAQQLLGPTMGASQVGSQFALPYAALLLERRSGQIAFIPSAAAGAGPAPTDAELQAFYKRNIARYTLPERRVARYAIVTPEFVKARTTPTDAEIAQAYQAGRAQFQAKELRSLTQVVVADQSGAAAIAAKAKGGTPLAAAAKAAGLVANTQPDVEKAAFAQATSPAIADAAFGGAQGSVVGPLRSPLGWTVARIDAVKRVAGKSLDQARAEITDALTKRRTAEALADVHDTMDGALAKNATFDEVVADQKLQPLKTAPLVANGSNPADPAAGIDSDLTPVVTAAFQAEDGDGPQLVPLGPNGSFALVALGQILPAAPRPLAGVRDTVAHDFIVERAQQAAHRIANQVVAKVNGGTPLAQALSQTRLTLPPPQPVSTSRAELARTPQGPPAPLALMFSVPQGATRLLASPRGDGWLIVHLDRITPGNPAGNPGLVRAAQADLGHVSGQELVEQFVNAVRKDVGVTTDANAMAKLKADIANQQGGSDN